MALAGLLPPEGSAGPKYTLLLFGSSVDGRLERHRVYTLPALESLLPPEGRAGPKYKHLLFRSSVDGRLERRRIYTQRQRLDSEL